MGCLGFEDRFITAVDQAKSSFTLNDIFFLKVTDEDSVHSICIEEIYEEHTNQLNDALDNNFRIKELALLESPRLLKDEVKRFLDVSCPNILLDISCFPKRFFFPILKLMLNSDQVQNLVVCYTLPQSYSKIGLAEDTLPWSHIPMFKQTEIKVSKKEKAIVGVGFMPYELPSLLKDDYPKAEINFVFPFPPGPPNYQRSWEFVRSIEKNYTVREGDSRIIRVDIKDVSRCYDHLLTISDTGNHSCVIAPYGPKTHSLAMALFASNFDCDVVYTQPRYYNPRYTTGVKYINGDPETYLYLIKSEGKNLYTTNQPS